MKNTFCLILLVLFSLAGIASADEVNQGLPRGIPESVETSTHLLIQSGIPSKEAVPLTSAMIQHRFSETEVLEAHQVIISAIEQNLDPEPIMNKAREGMAKQVQPIHIVQAMDKVRSRHQFAYALAGRLMDDEHHARGLGHVIADCLVGGITRDDAQLLSENLRTRTLNMDQSQARQLGQAVFETGRDMARLGVSSGLATETVSRALSHAYGPMEMATLRNRFVNQSRTTTPNQLARSFAQAIARGETAGQLGGSPEKGGEPGGGAGGGSGSGSGGESGSGSGGGSGSGAGGESGSGSGGGSGGGSGSGAGGESGSGSGGGSGSGSGGGSGGGSGSGSGGGRL